MSSLVDVLQKMFPRCPVCKSSEGYEPSPFYPNIACKSCQAELVLHKNGLELKRVSKLKWDEDLLNKTYPFDFWKSLKTPEFQIIERVFAPMDYVGGNRYYRNPVIGYIRIRADGLAYKSSEGSVHTMEVEVTPQRLAGLEIIKANDVSSVLDGKRLLIDTNSQYLLLKYKDQHNKPRQLILDFHGQEQNVNELISLANRLKVTKPKTKRRRAKKRNPTILVSMAKVIAANTRTRRQRFRS